MSTLHPASLFKRVLRDSFTTPNGDFEPARIVGYGVTILGALVFFFCTVYMVVKTQAFDAAQYAIGLGGVAATLAAAAAGVYIKKSDEIPYDPTANKTPTV